MSPTLARFWERASRIGRCVRFDKTGLSDHGAAVLSIAEQVPDIESVRRIRRTSGRSRGESRSDNAPIGQVPEEVACIDLPLERPLLRVLALSQAAGRRFDSFRGATSRPSVPARLSCWIRAGQPAGEPGAILHLK
jgi:hypothetical protein